MELTTLVRRLFVLVVAAGAAWALLAVGTHLGPFANDRFLRSACVVVLLLITAVGWSGPLRGQLARVGLCVVLVVLAAELLLLQAHGRVEQWGTDGQVAEWGAFHYYLGGKYFEELHYTDLYKQAVVADWDGGDGPNAFRAVPKVRDLHTYEFVSIEEARALEPLPAFSEARWAEWKADVAWFGTRAQGERWAKILGDRGYNPPPSYVVVGGTLANLLSIRSPVTQTLLINLDMLLLLLALAISVRAYGATRSLLVLCAFLAFYGNVNRVFGQIWILDWFAASWAGAAAWKLRRPGLSGGLIAYAACVRVFPGVLLIGPVVANLPPIVRDRAVPPHLVRFVGAAAVVTALLVAGSTLRYGTSAWADWAGAIAEHNHEHESGARRFGLKQIFVLDWAGGLQRTERKARTSRLARNAVPYRAVLALFLALTVACMLRTDEHDAMLLGAAIFFAGIIASRYYGALLVLLLLLGCGRSPSERDRSGGRPGRLLGPDVGLVLVILIVYLARFPGEPRLQYVFANTLWATWWIGLFSVRLWDRAPMQKEP